MAKRETPIGNQLVQYHANGQYMEQIYQVQDTLTAIYINVADEEDKEVFDKIDDKLDELKQMLVRRNSDIADKYFKTRP